MKGKELRKLEKEEKEEGGEEKPKPKDFTVKGFAPPQP